MPACRRARSTICPATDPMPAKRCGDTPEWTAWCSRARKTSACGSSRASRPSGPSRACSRWGARTPRSCWTRPLATSLFFEELFVPLLAIGVVSGLEQAITETNKAEYGLTAGIFSKKAEEIERFFDEIEAGVCYVNKRTGATTGAWPGAQPFTGWKGSGSTGKGGGGPDYVAPFMRGQSRTGIEG